MNTETLPVNVIRKYLLGQTSEAERLNLEERLIADDETYEELSIIEDELTDEYLRDQLSTTERQGFESHFLLTPSHQEKLRFAKAVRGYLATHARPEKVAATPRKSGLFANSAFRHPVLAYALAAVLVVVVAGTAWYSWKLSQSEDYIVSVTLTPGLVRGGSSQDYISIPRRTNRVRFELILADETPYQLYTAVFESIDGRVIGEASTVSSEPLNDGYAVTLELPARVLPSGEYRVKLSGLTVSSETVNLGSYSFVVLGP